MSSVNNQTVNLSTTLEDLADAMHDNWAHWMKYMLKNMTDENLARWKIQAETSYLLLPEDQKPSDRRAALRLIEKLKK